MLYYVQPGDNLYSIANRFGTTAQGILKANVICNPNLIFVGQPLIIPRLGEDTSLVNKSGGRPYYVILPGDSLWCLAQQFGTSIQSLMKANGIKSSDLIYSGSELLISFEIPTPQELYEQWDKPCDAIFGPMLHGIYYIGTFYWEANGEKGIPYLLDLLKHPCSTVRYYAAISLGRIGKNDTVIQKLNELLSSEEEQSLIDIVNTVIQRIELVKQYGKRVHVTIDKTNVYSEPNLGTQSFIIPENEPITVLRWHIPSPTKEEGPRGDIQIYDQIKVLRTGKIGFMSRAGFREIGLI